MPVIHARRGFIVLLVSLAAILSFIFLYYFPGGQRGKSLTTSARLGVDNVPMESLRGHAIAPKLGNETLKAELGRAAWKLFHTTMARFPDKPTADESSALNSYIYLFARLYPCGECAGHFQKILSKYPPQVSSRSTSAAWACHVHNEVNKSLKKDLFDCSKIGDFYDCGCADDEKERTNRGTPYGTGTGDTKVDIGAVASVKGILTDPKPFVLEKEGLTKGG